MPICKSTLVLAALAALALSPYPAHSAPAAPGKAPAARVNGSEIGGDALAREIQNELEARKRAGANEQGDPKELRQEVLDRLIAMELVHQAAVAARIQPSEPEIEAEMDKMRGQFQEQKKFEEMLASYGMTPATLRAELRRGLAIRAWLEREIEAKVKVEEAEVKKYYEDNPGSFQKPEAVKVRHILIRSLPQDSPEKKGLARSRAEAALARIKKGEAFDKVAREVSEDGSAKSGGDLGEVIRGATRGPFEDAAFGLAKGAVSGVVETHIGFHVIQTLEHVPAGTIPFERVQDSIREFLLNQRREVKAKAIMDEMRKKAKVEILDPGA